MKKVSIRDLRQKWPELERRLSAEGGYIITRDAMPVARLLPLEKAPARRRRFNPAEQLAWLKKTWGGRPSEPWVDAAIARDRADD